MLSANRVSELTHYAVLLHKAAIVGQSISQEHSLDSLEIIPVVVDDCFCLMVINGHVSMNQPTPTPVMTMQPPIGQLGSR